ncbi:hypothetical protein NL676_036667 [Syzygium grande]|nr:hypothetical protein NL676_036667 [Syzygium grande]
MNRRRGSTSQTPSSEADPDGESWYDDALSPLSCRNSSSLLFIKKHLRSPVHFLFLNYVRAQHNDLSADVAAQRDSGKLPPVTSSASRSPDVIESLLTRPESKRSSPLVRETAAEGVLKRLLPFHSHRFQLKIVPKDQRYHSS